jgi:hypothetical protein
MSASPALDTLISGSAFKTAVAKIVRSARASGGRKELSARGIREALEAEFACDLSACKNLILASITAALEENGGSEGAVDHGTEDTAESCTEPKRRKLSKSDASTVRLRPLPCQPSAPALEFSATLSVNAHSRATSAIFEAKQKGFSSSTRALMPACVHLHQLHATNATTSVRHRAQ